MQPATHGSAALIRLLPQAAAVSFGIAAFRYVEALVSPPPLAGVPVLVAALLAGRVFWL